MDVDNIPLQTPDDLVGQMIAFCRTMSFADERGLVVAMLAGAEIIARGAVSPAEWAVALKSLADRGPNLKEG